MQSIFDIRPAIVVVNYNRPQCTMRILNSISNARYAYNDITLVISIDCSDASETINEIAQSFNWRFGKKVIIKHKQRLGLKEHILSCGKLSEKYGAVIILEDDLFVSKNYYQYTVQAIAKYKKEKNVAGIALYSHAWNGYSGCFFSPQHSEFDTYFGQFSITWGQCWTKEQFAGFYNWLKNNPVFLDDPRLPMDVNTWGEKSWGRFFFKYLVEKGLYYVIPYKSFTTNFSDFGEHNYAASCSHQVLLESSNTDRIYSFPDFENGIFYDSFFDRVFTKNDVIGGISGNLICCDFNHCKRFADDKRYLLTDKKYKALEVVKTFGISIRPIELNPLYNVPGNDISLYKLTNQRHFVLKKEKLRHSRLAFELYGFSSSVLFRASLMSVFQKILRRMRRLFR